MQHPLDKSGYLSQDTIAAIATEVGGAISIVRVSGHGAFSALEQLTHSPYATKGEPRKLYRSPIYDAQQAAFDDVLFVRFVSPESFTGEDVVEFHIHGSPFIAYQLIDRLRELGVRQALPGEFSFRSVRNGKMSLFQAQGIADLIAASNSSAVSLALEKASGAQNAFLEELAHGLRTLATLGEVGIDFSDQDVDEVSLPRLKARIAAFIEILGKLQNSYSRGIRLQEGLRVAFVGLPNAGKSSFFNTLLGESRSIVSDIAGTTRDVVSEKLTLRGTKKTVTLRLEDTAGLRKTDQDIEKIGIERTYSVTRNADLILFVIDLTSPIEPSIEEWKNLNQSTEARLSERTIGVLTKVDLVTPERTQEILHKIKTTGILKWISTSSTTGLGIPQAIEAIVEFGEQATRRQPGELILTRIDHLNAVNEAIAHLQRAEQAPEIDLFASDIRQSLYSLAPLIGETVPDDILGKIFSDFCIGK